MDENERYRKVLRNYRKRFFLTQENINKLAGFPKNKYSRIESGKQDATLNDIKQIADVYGQTLSQILQLTTRYPSLNKLPERTREIAIENKKAGKKIVNEYQNIDLTNHVKDILMDYQVGDVFVPSKLFEKLPSEIKPLVKTSSKVTVRLIEELSEYVEKTGEKYKVKGKRGRQEDYYKLIKPVGKR